MKHTKKILFLLIMILFSGTFLFSFNTIKADETNSINLENNNIIIGVNEKFTLSPNVTSENYFKDDITYKSNDEEIATINSDGVIKGVKTGSTTMTLSLPDKTSANCNVEVRNAPTNISLSITKYLLKVGDKITLNPSIDGYSNEKLKYSSSDSSALNVDSNGVVTANKSSYGKSVTITISTYNGIEKDVTFYVVNKNPSFYVKYINDKSFSLMAGGFRQLYYYMPDNFSKSTLASFISFKSSDTSIATVSDSGYVIAKKAGSAYITISSTNDVIPDYKIKISVSNKKTGTKMASSNLNIVSLANKSYSYKEMKNDIIALNKKYGDILRYTTIGKSLDNRNLYLLTLGNPNAKKTIFVQGSMHGREYMASQLIMKQVEFYCRNYYIGTYNSSYIESILNDTKVCIVPMSNPDGVQIAHYGYKGISKKSLRSKVKRILKKNHVSHTQWKANARGVDLNRNFGSHWKKNYPQRKTPSFQKYRGKKSCSEPESKALVNWINKQKPTAVISYHAMGEVLYWNYGQKGSALSKSKKLRNTVNAHTKYHLMGRSDAYKTGTLGLSDWTSMEKKIPSLTIEIGNRNPPLKISQFNRIWKANKYVLLSVAKLY